MPVGFRIASAWVDIRAEDKGLRQQIKDAVEKATKGQEAKIELKIDSKGLRREVNNALKEATDKQKPKIALAIKSAGLRKEVTDALKRATEKQKPTVKLGISSVGLRSEVQRALKEATKDQKPTVRLGISTAGLRAEVQRALRIATSGEDGQVTVHVRVDDNRLKRALADSNPTITPNIDVRGLRQRMLAAIRQINVNDDVHINPNIDGELMARQIQSEVARLRDRYRVRIGTDVDTDTFAARIKEAARTVHSNINIDLNPRINQLKARAEAAAAFRDLRGKINFTGELNTAMTRAKLMASLKLAQAGAHITVPVRYDRNQLRYMFGSIEDAFRAVEGPTGKWANIIQAGAMGALPAFALLDHAIRSTGPALAVTIPMVSMMASAFVAAKIGMQGMGTVINGIFNESILTNHQLDVLDVTMKGLSPSALRFANAMKNVKGQFTDLRVGVQQILFTNLDTSLNQFAKQTLPVLQLGLAGTADQLNRMVQSTVNMVNTSARTGELKRAFGAVQMAMEPLIPVPGQILNAITKMTISAAPLLIRMTQSFGHWTENMTAKLNKAFNNGTLQASISKAGDVIVNFFRRIANNQEFRTFLDRMKANGPAIAKTFGDIATALMKIVNALAPISGVVMKVVDAFAKFVNAIPSVFLDAFIIKLVIFKTALGITGVVKSLVTALGGLKMAIIALGSTDEMMLLFATRLEALGVAYKSIMRLSSAFAFLTRTGILLGGLALTFVTLSWAVDKLFGDGRIHVNVQAMADSLNHLRVTGQSTGEMAKTFGKNFDKLGEAMSQIAHPGTWDRIDHGFKRIGEAIAINGDSWQKNNDTMKAADKTLSDLVKNGDMATVSVLYKRMTETALKHGVSVAKLNTLLPGFQKSLKASRDAQKLAADTMGVFGDKAQTVSTRLQQLKSDTDGLVQSLFALNNTQRDANQAVRDMESAAEAMVAATKKKAIGLKFENGQLIQNTKAQQEAAAAIEDYAGKTEKSAIATYQANGNWEQAAKSLANGKKAIVAAAEAAGMGTTAAEAYANSIFKIPSKKEVTLMLVDQATQQLQDVASAFRATPDKKTITVSTLNNAAIKGLQDLGYQVKQLPDGSFTVTAKTKQSEAALAKIEKYKIDPKTVEVFAKITAFTMDIQNAQSTLDGLKQKRKTAVGADKAKLDAEIKKAQKKVDDLKQKRKVALEALDKTHPGVAAAQRALDSLHDKKVDVVVMTSYQQVRNKGYNGNSATGGHAAGGFIAGPGSGTSDSILARLSNGEFVLKAAAVKKYGLNFLNGLNAGKMPKFAGGGQVTGYAGGGGVFNAGTAIETLTVKANTTDVLTKLGRVSAALSTMNRLAPKAVSIRATDNTKKATDQAKANFRAIPTVSQTAYTKIKGQTAAFGNSLASQMNGVKDKNASVWKSIGSSLQTSITGAYNKVKGATSAFGNNTVSAITGIKTRSNAQWNQFQSQMIASTNKTYGGVKNATASFGSQNVSKMKSIVEATGSAWGGLSGKFKPPISYLIHTVINSGLVGSMNAITSKLGGGKKIGGISVAGFADGGPIYGAGSKTSDSIPARLSHGEFVMRAAAVDKFGVGFMNSLNSGRMPHDGAGFKPGFASGGLINIKMAPGFAAGGSVPSADTLNKIMGDGSTASANKMTDFIMNNYVLPLIDSGSGGSAMKDVQRAGMQHIRSNVESFVKDNFGGAGSAAAGLRWAKTQYGKPYQWGGNGNPSWDCSGFMSAIESVIRGEKPHRRWATGSFSGSSAPPGWKLNATAPFRIGVTNAGVGHTAGTIGKENVESSGGIGVHGGAGARGWNDPMFPMHYGYVGPNAQKAMGGYISGPGGSTSDKIHAMLSNGEYVIRAAAVKKLGLNYLNTLNAGQVPGFSTGGYTKTKGTGKNKRYYYHGKWYTLAGYRKAKSDYDKQQAAAKAQATSEKEGRGSLTGDLTFSHFGQMAVAQGSWKDNEFENNLGQPGSIGDLVNSLNGYRADIMKSFHGAQETKLLKKLDSSGKALLANEKKLEGVNAALDTAKSTLADLKDKFDSLKDSVSENIKSYGAITKVGKYGTNPTTLLDQLKTDAGKATTFSGQLDQLKAMGIDPDLIQQIASAGITEGGATAQTILGMTPDQVAQLNAYQKQLTDAANKAGTTTADAMYGAGIQAAQGLVDGLTKQQKAIEDAMMAIAKSMEAAIKQALGIKSPSRVMMAVADFTADGLENQLLARTAGIHRVMQNLVVPTTGVSATPIVGKVPGTISTGGPAGHVTNIGVINVNVTGTFNLNTPAERRALAKLLAKDIKEEIRKDDKAHR